MWTDTHAHLDVFAAENDLDGALERATTAGVSRIVAIGGDPEANVRAAAIAAERPDRVWAAVAFDRALAAQPPPLEKLRALALRPEVVAIGETGLDYYHEQETAAAQRALFGAMLELAAESRKPAIVHSRAADADTLALLAAYVRDRRVSAERAGVVHCFTGDWPFARALLDLGFFLGISGIVTFRNAESLRDVVRRAPEDRLLVETDAPYLAPTPMRGRRNEPAFVRFTGEFVASLRGCEAERFAHSTTGNAYRLFGGSMLDDHSQTKAGARN